MGRMRNMVAFLLGFVLCAWMARAQEPVEGEEAVISEAVEDTVVKDALLNDPPESVSLVKEIISRLDFSYETVVDLYNGDAYQGVSGSLYNLTSNDIHLASLRLGASTGMSIYSGASLDLPGLTKRYLPPSVQDAASPTPLDTVWSVIGKYGRVGLIGGWSFDHDDPVIGMTAGVATSF